MLCAYNEKGISALTPQFAGAGITLTHCAPGAHVHIVERAIRYVKEGARGILASLPYQCPKSLFRFGTVIRNEVALAIKMPA